MLNVRLQFRERGYLGTMQLQCSCCNAIQSLTGVPFGEPPRWPPRLLLLDFGVPLARVLLPHAPLTMGEPNGAVL